VAAESEVVGGRRWPFGRVTKRKSCSNCPKIGLTAAAAMGRRYVVGVMARRVLGVGREPNHSQVPLAGQRAPVAALAGPSGGVKRPMIWGPTAPGDADPAGAATPPSVAYPAERRLPRRASPTPPSVAYPAERRLPRRAPLPC